MYAYHHSKKLCNSSHRHFFTIGLHFDTKLIGWSTQKIFIGRIKQKTKESYLVPQPLDSHYNVRHGGILGTPEVCNLIATSYIGSTSRLTWNWLIFWSSHIYTFLLFELLFIFIRDTAKVKNISNSINRNKYIVYFILISEYKCRSCTLVLSQKLTECLKSTWANLKHWCEL